MCDVCRCECGGGEAGGVLCGGGGGGVCGGEPESWPGGRLPGAHGGQRRERQDEHDSASYGEPARHTHTELYSLI